MNRSRMLHAPSPSSDTLPAASRRDVWHWLSVGVLLLFLVSLPFVVRAAIRSWQNNNNDLVAWADDQLPVKKQFTSFVRLFGRPELVVASWPGCHADSAELAQLAHSLKSAGVEWFDRIHTTQTVVESLAAVPGSLTDAEIRSQLSGVLIGADGQQACLIAELGPEARQRRPEAMIRLRSMMVDCGVAERDVRIGGMGSELAALDHESVAAPARLTPFTGVIMLVLCTWFLRSLALGVFVAALGAFTGILSAALIEWCGVQSNAVLATLPTLGGLLAVSLSLHFIGYYHGARTDNVADFRAALRQAYRWAWKPTLISAVTTAMGLGSLLLSRTQTIRQFGFFGALITLCAAIVTLTALPAFLRLMGDRVRVASGTAGVRRWRHYVLFLQRRPWTMIVVVTCLGIAAVFGLQYLKTGVHVDNLFVDRHSILQDERWFEQHVGPLASLEIVVSFPIIDEASPRSRRLAQQLARVQKLENRLRATERFSVLTSMATGLADLNRIRGVRRLAAVARLRKWLDDHFDQLIDSGLYATSDHADDWRLSVRIPAVTQERTSDIRALLVQQIEHWREEWHQTDDAPEFFVTGLPLLFEQIEEQFIEDLLITYISGLLLISVTVLIVLRSVADAVTAMFPNVLPAVGVLGGISLLGIELDVGSVMTASIALGVAVDDTLHFVLWYQRERKSGRSSRRSVRSAVLHCGAPILQTSVMCGLGLAILGVAPFLPTARFGTLIALMLVVALVGDLLFLPAMLSVRRGSDRRHKHRS